MDHFDTFANPPYNSDQVRSVIEQLSAIGDPISLVSYLLSATRHLKEPGPTPWYYTAEYYAKSHAPEQATRVAATFELVGVEDENDAVLWLAEHAASLTA